MSHSSSQLSGSPADRSASVAEALAELGVRIEERVLILLPDGPDFVDAFAGTMKQGAVPLPVNPQLAAVDVAAIATETGARVVLASVERIQGLADLGAEPPVPVDGSQGLWAAALRQR